jgi:glucan phosphoethanolaminetransferase (alkaline phosphatase superfamily)
LVEKEVFTEEPKEELTTVQKKVITVVLKEVLTLPLKKVLDICTLSPLVIFLITELMEILGPESSQERKLKLVPLTIKARFAITNLLLYTAIISVKLMIVQLIVLVLVIAAAFSAVYLFALYRERRQRQQAMGKIRALNTEKAGDERFDQKVRAYHELRGRK